MTKDERELYNTLIEDGYGEDYAEFCLDYMVSKERAIDEVVGFLEEIYHSRMEEVASASEGMKDFVSSAIKERLSEFSTSFIDDWYTTTGFNLILESDLDKRLFSIYGGGLFVLFDNEEDSKGEDSIFHPISDVILCNKKIREEIENRVNCFEWEKEEEVIKANADTNEVEEIGNSVYNVAVRWLKKNFLHDEKMNNVYNKIQLLVGQYFYGKCIHKELKNALEEVGINLIDVND